MIFKSPSVPPVLQAPCRADHNESGYIAASGCISQPLVVWELKESIFADDSGDRGLFPGSLPPQGLEVVGWRGWESTHAQQLFQKAAASVGCERTPCSLKSRYALFCRSEINFPSLKCDEMTKVKANAEIDLRSQEAVFAQIMFRGVSASGVLIKASPLGWL